MEKKTYRVKFMKHESGDEHVQYIVKVISGKGNETFQIKDRYSSMRDYWKSMIEEYGKAVPSTFPPKKWFGNKDPTFVQHRMEELEHFFNTMLEDPKLATSAITQTYFTNKKMKVQESVKPPAGTATSGGKPPASGTTEPHGPVLPVQNTGPSTTVHDKKWRQIADAVTKTYIDISFGDEPPPVEEIKKKSSAYSSAINSSLTTIPYISKLLNLPRGDEKHAAEMSLSRIENEGVLSFWLDEKMKTLSQLVQNGSQVIYARDSIYFEFTVDA